jgi:2-phospho-L-lactate guanylyltransferase
MSDRTCVILPMKSFALAKSRLRDGMSDQARSALARAMFERTLVAALQCRRVDDTYVVTNGDDVAATVDSLADARIRMLRDPGPNMQLADLMDWALNAVASSATRALILMADLPRLETRDIDELCGALDDSDCVLVSDQRGHSTNALGIRLPFRGATSFGQPESFALHKAVLHGLGLRIRHESNVRVAHDVDLLEDLSAARGLMPGATAPVSTTIAAKGHGC